MILVLTSGASSPNPTVEERVSLLSGSPSNSALVSSSSTSHDTVGHKDIELGTLASR